MFNKKSATSNPLYPLFFSRAAFFLLLSVSISSSAHAQDPYPQDPYCIVYTVERNVNHGLAWGRVSPVKKEDFRPTQDTRISGCLITDRAAFLRNEKLDIIIGQNNRLLSKTDKMIDQNTYIAQLLERLLHENKRFFESEMRTFFTELNTNIKDTLKATE